MIAVYQPDPATIDYAAARARRRLPDLATRIELAVAILHDLTHRVSLAEDGAWHYHSPRDAAYRVDPSGCTCPNYVHHRGQPDRYYCKHLLTYFGWRRILIDALKCYANPHGICQIRYSGDGELVPATPLDFALLSHYLATGRPYRQPTLPDSGRARVGLPDPLETTQPATEWQPTWSTGAFRHWLATGELPYSPT